MMKPQKLRIYINTVIKAPISISHHITLHVDVEKKIIVFARSYSYFKIIHM